MVISRQRAMVIHLIPQMTHHPTVMVAVMTAMAVAVTDHHLLTHQDHLQVEAAQAHRMVVDQGLQILHNHHWGMIHPQDERYFP